MSHLVKFTAQVVDGGDEDFAVTVGFAHDPSDEQADGLILQRAKEDDPDDQGIYAEVPIQRHTSYRGIEKATFARGCFSIVFTPETVRDFDGITGMEISFGIPKEQFDRIATLLTRIFRGHDGFQIEKG